MKIVDEFIFQGVKRDTAPGIAGVSIHQYYHHSLPDYSGQKLIVLLLKKTL